MNQALKYDWLADRGEIRDSVGLHVGQFNADEDAELAARAPLMLASIQHLHDIAHRHGDAAELLALVRLFTEQMTQEIDICQDLPDSVVRIESFRS